MIFIKYELYEKYKDLNMYFELETHTKLKNWTLEELERNRIFYDWKEKARFGIRSTAKSGCIKCGESNTHPFLYFDKMGNKGKRTFDEYFANKMSEVMILK